MDWAPCDPRRIALERGLVFIRQAVAEREILERKDLALRDRRLQLRVLELEGWMRAQASADDRRRQEKLNVMLKRAAQLGLTVPDSREAEVERYAAAIGVGSCCQACHDSLKQKDAWAGEVRTVLATLTTPGSPPVVDRDGDVILAGSLDNNAAVVSPWNHSAMRDTARAVGAAELFEDGDRLIGVIAYDSSPEGRRACARVLNERPDWSVGYVVLDQREPNTAERRAGAKRIIQRWRVGEVSPVDKGAGVAQGTISACCGSCSTAAA